MPRFRYIATSLQGESLQGEIEGADLAEARRALLQSGLQILELRSVFESTSYLSTEEAAAISQQITSTTQSQLPLIGSMRAFAEEALSSRMRQRLIRVCDRLEAGRPLQEVLADPALRLPASVTAILGSGLSQPAINQLLNQTMRSASMTLELRMRSFFLVCYTLAMLVAICGLWLFLLVYLTPQFDTIFSQTFTLWGTELPSALTQLINLSHLLRSMKGLFLLLLIPPAGLLVYLAMHFGLSAPTRRRIWCGIPIIGSMYRLTALSEVANSLALMLENQVPLAQAITWSTAGANDADLQSCGEDIAARLRWGDDPVAACQTTRGVPAYIQQMMHWASQGAAGAEPLRSMAKLLQIRARSLAAMALPLMEPVLLVATVVSVGVYVVIVFLPLIKLLNDLS